MVKINLDNTKSILKFHYDNLTIKEGGRRTLINFLELFGTYRNYME